MNWLDIVIVCLAGIGIVKGLFDGIIKQVISLIALVIGILFCGKVAVWLQGHLLALDWFPPETVTILSYILGFLLIAGVVILAGIVMHKIIGVTPLSVINHLLGGFLGLVMMLFFMSLFFNLLEFIDQTSALISSNTKAASRFYAPVTQILPTILPIGLFTMK